MKETLVRLFSHMRWADRQALAALRDAKGNAEALGLYAHVLATERVWYLRLQNEDWKQQKVWPTLTLDECAGLADVNVSSFARYVDQIEESDLTHAVTYINTKGETFTNTVGDILVHVILHGVHHRGQIATSLRRGGAEPPVLDYIRWVREF